MMKLRERTVTNYNVDRPSKRSKDTSKPASLISRRRKSSPVATIEATKIVSELPAPPVMTSALKIRLRREIAATKKAANAKNTQSKTRTPKKNTQNTSSPNDGEFDEVASILLSFIQEGEKLIAQQAITEEEEENGVVVRSIRLSAPPALMGLPNFFALPHDVSASISSLPPSIATFYPDLAFHASSEPSSLGSSLEMSELVCQSPPCSPPYNDESSPSSSSPCSAPSSPRESRPTSPHSFKLERTSSDEFHDRSGKRKRTRTTQAQLQVLENIFEEDKTPCKARRDEIGVQLNMSSRSVQVWFQNRRSKLKKVVKDTPNSPQAAFVPSSEQPAQPIEVVQLKPVLPTILPPAFPIFNSLNVPLPLPQIIQSPDLHPPTPVQRPTPVRKGRRYIQQEPPQQQQQQQVFILPKAPLPILEPIHVTSSESSTPKKRYAKRLKTAKATSEETETIKVLEAVQLPAGPIAQPTTIVPRPLKRKAHTDFSRATLVPVSAKN